MKFIKERIEWLYATLLALDMLKGGALLLRAQFPGVAAFVTRYNVYFLETALVVSFAATALLVQRNRQSQAREASLAGREAALAQTNRSLTVDLEAQARHRAKVEQCGQIYHTFARENAGCDWDLFQGLFVHFGRLNGVEDRGAEIQRAIQACQNNIQQVLTVAARVMSVHTGDVCAACIQLIDPFESRDFVNAAVETVARDVDSAAVREFSSEIHAVRDNTLHQRIFIAREPCVIVNDLARLIREDKSFQTSARIDPGVYNALFITPVPSMAEFRPVRGQKAGRVEPRATLCIDNRRGGFDRDLHLRLVQELAWRIAVMLYRADRLGYAQERLG